MTQLTGVRSLGVVAALALLTACTAQPPASAPLATATDAPPSATAPEPSPSGPEPVAVPSIDVEAELDVAWEAGPPSATPGTWSVAVDPQGMIWATASQEDQIWILDRDGGFVEEFGTPGTGDGEFEFSNESGNVFGSIGFAPDGSFYVADTGNQRVQRFDADREFVSAWGSFGTADGQFVSPSCIAVSGDGSVYVLDDARQDIQRFDADGTFVEVVAAGAIWPASLAADADGNVYYIEGEDATLTRRSADGEITLRANLAAISGPFWTDIAVDSDGNIYVTSETSSGASPEPSHLLVLDPEGVPMHLWPNGGNGIDIDPSGDRIYTAFATWDHVTAYTLPAE